MAEQIKDGVGRGYVASVNEHNLLGVQAVSASVEHWVNHHLQTAYQLLFDVTPTGAGDCFLYLKNTSGEDVIVEGIWLSVGSAEQVEVHLRDTGTPAGGAAATPVNMNTNTSNAATGTFQTGNDITGLSGGQTAEKWWVTSAEHNFFNFEQDLVIGQNGTLTLYATTGGINVRGTLVFNYHEQET